MPVPASPPNLEICAEETPKFSPSSQKIRSHVTGDTYVKTRIAWVTFTLATPIFQDIWCSGLDSRRELRLVWAAIEKPPDGREILMKMADFLSKAPNWSVTVHSAYDAVQPNGSKVEWNEVRTVTLSRPDRLRVEGERSDGARTLVIFNGKEITTFDESAKVYAQAPHPGSVNDAVVYLFMIWECACHSPS